MTAGFVAFDLTLRDGRAVHVRGVSPADEAEFLQAFDRMSDDDRYMRFMRFVREANRERLREVLASFPECGIGIVATTPAGEGFDIVGSAVYFIQSDRPACEFAISVASAFGGAGLASALMRALIEAARARGMEEMEGYVLAANHPMLHLARRLGFTVTRDPDDGTRRICRLRLGDA
jgi:acetyltransferase